MQQNWSLNQPEWYRGFTLAVGLIKGNGNASRSLKLCHIPELFVGKKPLDTVPKGGSAAPTAK